MNKLSILLLTLIGITYTMTGTCKLSQDPSSTLNVTGTVVFLQDSVDNITRISYSI
jgi:hypothetical protein